MGIYYYNGKLTSRRSCDGLVAAKSEKEARSILTTQAVSKAKLFYLGSLNGYEYQLIKQPKMKKLKKKDVAYLFTQLSFLIKSGVTTFEAIEVLSVSANVSIAKVCQMIRPMIIEGRSLSDSLQETGLFTTDIVEKVRAAEISNSMENALENISMKLKEELELVSSIKGGITYPLFSLVSVFAIAMVMLIFLVPQIAGIVEDFGAELPALTKALISMSDFIIAYWYYMVAAVAAIVYVHLMFMKKNIKYKKFVHKTIYEIPVVGPIAKKINLIYFSSILSQLLNNGKNTSDSIGLAKKTVSNRYLFEALDGVEKNIVRKGMDLYSAMVPYDVFPMEFLQMIVIGVRTGNVSEVLESIYTQYRYEVKDEIKAATELIQPISMILIGIVVGVFVLGMYSAIYCLIDAV